MAGFWGFGEDIHARPCAGNIFCRPEPTTPHRKGADAKLALGHLDAALRVAGRHGLRYINDGEKTRGKSRHEPIEPFFQLVLPYRRRSAAEPSCAEYYEGHEVRAARSVFVDRFVRPYGWGWLAQPEKTTSKKRGTCSGSAHKRGRAIAKTPKTDFFTGLIGFLHQKNPLA